MGENAEKQPSGSFSFIRGAGIEGYKVAAGYIVIAIPVKSEEMDQRFFCNACRNRLASNAKRGYVLADLKDPDEPVVDTINTSTLVRCYSVSMQYNTEKDKYRITIMGHWFK